MKIWTYIKLNDIKNYVWYYKMLENSMPLLPRDLLLFNIISGKRPRSDDDVFTYITSIKEENENTNISNGYTKEKRGRVG